VKAASKVVQRRILRIAYTQGIDADFYWLGRVPCRTVKLVGLLVGVQTYETRIVYHGEFLPKSEQFPRLSFPVDDGTAVIECNHRPPAQNTAKQDKSTKLEPPPLLEPIAYVGCSVIVIGRVSPWRDTRRILVDSIGETLKPYPKHVLTSILVQCAAPLQTTSRNTGSPCAIFTKPTIHSRSLL
jgi:hypothetical protein